MIFSCLPLLCLASWAQLNYGLVVHRGAGVDPAGEIAGAEKRRVAIVLTEMHLKARLKLKRLHQS